MKVEHRWTIVTDEATGHRHYRCRTHGEDFDRVEVCRGCLDDARAPFRMPPDVERPSYWRPQSEPGDVPSIHWFCARHAHGWHCDEPGKLTHGCEWCLGKDAP